jgi:hypothetical protein
LVVILDLSSLAQACDNALNPNGGTCTRQFAVSTA